LAVAVAVLGIMMDKDLLVDLVEDQVTQIALVALELLVKDKMVVEEIVVDILVAVEVVHQLLEQELVTLIVLLVVLVVMELQMILMEQVRITQAVGAAVVDIKVVTEVFQD
jgi:hypothetical protein